MHNRKTIIIQIKEVLKVEKFKRVTIKDKGIIKKYVEMTRHQACDYSVAGLILWSEVYQTEYAIENEILFIKFQSNNQTYFTYPMGKNDLEFAFHWMQDYCREASIEFRMHVIEPDMFALIQETFPDKYDIVYVRDNADYVYKMEDLKNLPGKKYHGKKNHINKFLKTNDNWVYERITEQNVQECIGMVKEWCIQNGCCEDEEKAQEICVMIKGIEYRDELALLGGLIRTDGRVVAMTLGEQLNEDTFVIHFEKAFADVPGAYPMINQQFILNELTGYTYINREEDMGVEGLRKAKESYKPEFLVQKGYLAEK